MLSFVWTLNQSSLISRALLKELITGLIEIITFSVVLHRLKASPNKWFRLRAWWWDGTIKGHVRTDCMRKIGKHFNDCWHRKSSDLANNTTSGRPAILSKILPNVWYWYVQTMSRALIRNKTSPAFGCTSHVVIPRIRRLVSLHHTITVHIISLFSQSPGQLGNDHLQSS